MTASVEAVHVGSVETFRLPDGDELTSAIRKSEQRERVAVAAAGFVGDMCHDPAHGGPNRAVHVFAAEHYDEFERRAGKSLGRPLVGENLRVRGHPDEIARVGDRVRVGSALLQVTMPTERCRNPGRVHQVPLLLKWMIEDLRTGFYLRVLEPGEIGAGDRWELETRGDARWTIRDLSGAMLREVGDPAIVAELQQLEVLAPEWQERLLVLHERRRRQGRTGVGR